MRGNSKKRFALSALSALLCVPLCLGALAGCGGGDTDETPSGGQTSAEDSAPISFTGLGETVNLDGYAQNALDKEIDYLLSIDEDKMLYNFDANAGLAPLAASRYGGWENSLIAGHSMGHYLTALAQAYSNGGTAAADKTALGEKLDKILEEFLLCQAETPSSKTGAKEGFLWGANATHTGNVEFQFDNVEQGKTNIFTEAWVPWYTMHKLIAGLVDVYTLTGKQDALTVAEGLGMWVYERVSKWGEGTRKTVLSTEYGGMNDCLYNLYAVTGKTEYAVAAHQFDEDIPTQGTFSQDSMVTRILDGDANYLNGQHANTTIPKIIGLLNGYIRLNGKDVDGIDPDRGDCSVSDYLEVAEKFWDRVVSHHTYATGGNSNDEHFQNDDTQWARRSNVNCETCNTYNMLKLSRMLFSLTKDKKYLDYYERTYINAILSSQDPETGMTMYFQPMAPGYFKVYSSPFDHFWCCTGSGMESMSKLNDSLYYDAGNATYVAMYMSSTYKTDAMSLTTTADLENSDTVTIRVDEGGTILRLRRPDWTVKFDVSLDGNAVQAADTDGFVSVEAHAGETVTVTLGKQIEAETLPNADGVYAFRYGPYVLSAELGTDETDQTENTEPHGVQVKKASAPSNALKTTYRVSNNSLSDFRENINAYMTRGADGKFTLTGIEGGPLTYSVHYKQHTQRYAIYLTFQGEEKQGGDTREETEIESVIQPGRGQYEGGGFLEGGETSTGSASGSRAANAGSSFSYWVAVDKTAAGRNFLVTSLAKADNGKPLKMAVGDVTIYENTLNYAGSEEFYDLYVPIPASVVNAAESKALGDPVSVKDRVKVTVSSGKAGEASAAVYGYFKTVKIGGAGTVAYFVDCGDYNTSTLSDGDSFGLYNTVTEQIYGADASYGGVKWGIYDDSSSVTAPTPQAGKGLGTNTTWAYEFSADGAEKTVTNRYTKNQYESGWQTFKLAYKFDLPDGKYTVKVYFTDPWGCSQNPSIAANGNTVKTGCAIETEISVEVTVTGGELLLEFTSQKNDTTQKCVNLCYIIIEFA